MLLGVRLHWPDLHKMYLNMCSKLVACSHSETGVLTLVKSPVCTAFMENVTCESMKCHLNLLVTDLTSDMTIPLCYELLVCECTMLPWY